MNTRKLIDYSAVFYALDTLMAAQLPQMELYWIMYNKLRKLENA